jgi:hypothetical protein
MRNICDLSNMAATARAATGTMLAGVGCKAPTAPILSTGDKTLMAHGSALMAAALMN